MKKLCLVLAIFSMLAAACGGSTEVVLDDADVEASDGADASAMTDDDTQEAEPAEQAAEPTAAPPTPEDEPVEEPTAAPPADSSDSEASLGLIPAEALQTVLNTDDWCTAAAAVNEGTDILDTIDFMNPIELREGYLGAQTLVAASARLAPPEIAADVQQSIVGFNALTAALEDAEWNFLDLDLSVIESLDTEMEAATYNIERYNFDQCNVGSDPGEPPVPSDDVFGEDSGLSGQGTIRDQAVQGIMAEGFTEEEATCIVDGLDFSNPEALSDVNEILAVFTDCGIPLDRLAELGG